jgi:hypothetical protein
MLLNILIIILGLFLLVAFESFFVTLASFSVLIILLLLLIDKWEWKRWAVFAFLSALLIDVVLHRTIGISLLTVSISTLVLYLMFLIVPKKEVILSYIPYFFAIFVFYILINLVGPFVQESVWGVISLSNILGYIVKAVISTSLIFLINTVIDNFRSNDQIRL